MSEDLILVDILDREIGAANKTTTHATPFLHRAFSIFIIDDSGDVPLLLLQRRALDKYHSGGLWANTCCSHPRSGEALFTAAARRLKEEIGITCTLREIGAFIYYYRFAPNLFEYEFDHVLIGWYRGLLNPNPVEVADLAWVSADQLLQGLISQPWEYAPWLPMVASLLKKELG